MKNNKRLSFIAFSIIAWVALIIMGHVTLSAHGVLSKEVETGKVRFSYDDDSPMSGGYISVYDKDGKEIATGQTDDDGMFDFSKYENVGKITVTDTFGHHRTHVIAAEHQDQTPSHRHSQGNQHHWITIIVVAALLAVAAVFYLGKKKHGLPEK